MEGNRTDSKWALVTEREGGELQRKLGEMLDNKSNVTILDFGCANGRRGVELLTFLKVYVPSICSKTLRLVAYDTNPAWEAYFRESLSKVTINGKFITNEDDIKRCNSIDVIYISHLLYSRRSPKHIMRMFPNAGPKTIIIVRGAAPSSFFWATSRAVSKHFFRVPRRTCGSRSIW